MYGGKIVGDDKGCSEKDEETVVSKFNLDRRGDAKNICFFL